MPGGFERLNERSQRPNVLIDFIKPLATSSPDDQKIAKDFLERIAAQCYPVMKREQVVVRSLEEYEPNREFLGRNFNAGEVIQLVLKDKAGRWLSFTFVQMVMMHELAHCKQMNHSRAFWQVRNRYADHMKELWKQKYEGEGVWGRGQNLSSGAFINNLMPDNADIPEHLCGGAYRRARGRKRKRGANDDGAKSSLTYAERQQKRIARKFGVHGEGHDLGEDELVRGALEKSKRRPGKPKVANSKRGRELRASAALARFDAAMKKQQQQHALEKTPELVGADDSETDSFDEEDDSFADGPHMLDTLGKIKDQRGRDMYKVCGDESEQQEGAQNELDELELLYEKEASPTKTTGGGSTSNRGGKKPAPEPHEDSETESEPGNGDTTTKAKAEGTNPSTFQGITTPSSGASRREPANEHDLPAKLIPSSNTSTTVASSNNITICPICTMENAPDSPTCIACSHVLKTSLMPNHWRCKSEQCRGSAYVNAGDVGRCSLCGSAKPAATEKKPLGVVGADVLRWD